MSIHTGEPETGLDRPLLQVAGALYVDGVTAEVVTALDHAGVPTIVLKGPSIARWLYPEGGRTYRDTDLLVPRPKFDHAQSVLRSLGFTERLEGFRPFERDSPAVEAPFVRSIAPGFPHEAQVDLHRNLPDLPAPDDLVWETFSARCETMPVGGVEVRVLDHTALALHIVVHAVQHGFAFHTDEDLRRAIDALSVESWGDVAALARTLGADGVLGLGLCRHPQAADIADRLGLPRAAVTGSSFEWRYLRTPRGVDSLALLCTASTFREKARIVRWRLVPSRAKVLRDLARSGARRRSVLHAYLHHWRGAAAAVRPAVRFLVHQRRRERRARLP